MAYRQDIAKAAGHRNNISKAGESTTAAILVGGLLEAPQCRAGDRAARVTRVELIEQSIHAVVPGLSLGGGVFVLGHWGVLPRLRLLLALVLLRLLLVRLRLTLVLGRGGSGQGGNGSDGELHCDGFLGWEVSY